MMICVFVIFLLSVTVALENGECVAPWKQIGSGCYLIREKKTVSPDAAFAFCTQLDAYLVNFETLEEALLIRYEIKSMKTGKNYIVGGRNINRYQPSGDWRWIRRGNMTKITYFAFGGGQPNGNNDHPQDCLMLYMPDQYQWHDINCDDTSYGGGYICEK